MKDFDKLIDDIYQIGRTDVELDVDDWKKLRPGVKKKLLKLVSTHYRDSIPKRKDVMENLDHTTPEMIVGRQYYNQAITDMERTLEK